MFNGEEDSSFLFRLLQCLDQSFRQEDFDPDADASSSQTGQVDQGINQVSSQLCLVLNLLKSILVQLKAAIQAGFLLATTLTTIFSPFLSRNRLFRVCERMPGQGIPCNGLLRELSG